MSKLEKAARYIANHHYVGILSLEEVWPIFLKDIEKILEIMEVLPSKGNDDDNS